MNKERIKLFDASNIDKLAWPDTPEGRQARNFLLPLIKEGVSKYIENVHTDLQALQIDQLILPITINDHQYQNSYVCSPYDYYITYALESLNYFKYGWIRPPIKIILNMLSKIFKIGQINKVVMINNWLLSTNLHPKITHEQINEIRKWLQLKFPHHAIIMRSIHTYEGPELFNTLSSNSFSLIAAREVFFLDARQESIFNSRIFKSDLKLLRESEYSIVPHEDIPLDCSNRLAELYSSVYLNRHSNLNPKLNAKFMRLALENKILTLNALQKNGSIDAITGYLSHDHIMTSPILGYDTSHSRDDKLYRLSATILSLEARKHKKLFHLSSGASFFKKIRKAKGNLEYMAVYHNHLPLNRRLPWWLLKAISLTMKPFFRSYQG